MPRPPCACCKWRPDVPSRPQLAPSFYTSLQQACCGDGRVSLEPRLSQNNMWPKMAWNSLQYSCLSFLSGSTMPTRSNI